MGNLWGDVTSAPKWFRGTAVACMSVVIVALSMGIGRARGWDASQWSAYGTWFTGFATFAAVVVALWQANQARAQANELYRRQTHSAALAVQRSELMLLWPVLDKAHLAALEYPTSFRLSESEARATERSEWLRMLTELRLARSRARVFLYDEEVLRTIDHVVQAFDLFDNHVRAEVSGELQFQDDESRKAARARRLRHINACRTALQEMASARLAEFASPRAIARGDEWTL